MDSTWISLVRNPFRRISPPSEGEALRYKSAARKTFSAETLGPLAKLTESNQDKIIKASRERYSASRQEVEEKIARWTGMLEMPQTPPQSFSAGPVLYDARCSMCGKDTKVVFQPDGKRPVYCKSCRNKLTRPAPAQSEALGRVRQNTEFLAGSQEEPVGVVPFGRPKPQRKEVNLSELRQALEESLEKPEEKQKPKNNSQGGIIKPGETVKF